MKRQKVELLAPAGNIEAFYGAIHAGADAIYLGGDKFGARAYADNFTTEELIHCIRYAHIFGRRVYLTVNTLVKDKEWDQLYAYIRPFYEAGLDGVIIQDIGVFLYLKEHFPGMELHVSTQMTLTGSYGAEYMKQLGACRIVPARELSLDEIRQIKADTGLEIEAFIHGAMCYCYSGQCLFSSILGGRSGNRGRCAQPCRLPYSVQQSGRKSGECYPLSLKDMCTIEHIPELIEAGIDSFKIEGRMKKAEYAAGVTAIYRKVIDRYYSSPRSWQVSRKELQQLSTLYIRSERHDGYYHKHNGADMVTLDNPAYSGSDEELLAAIRSKYIGQRPRLSVDIYARFASGEAASLTLACGEQCVTVTGDIVEAAQKQPVTAETFEKQFKKLGDTVFIASETRIDIEGEIFYPLKAINELRRRAVIELENRIIESHGLYVSRESKEPLNVPHIPLETIQKNGLVISISTVPQLRAVIRQIKEYHSIIKNSKKDGTFPLKKLYLEGDLLAGEAAPDTEAGLRELYDVSEKAGCPVEIYPVLPYIIRKRDDSYLTNLENLLQNHLYSGCMVRSLEGYAWLEKIGYPGRIAADSGFYIWNQETLRYWQDKLDSFSLPWELNASEQWNLIRDASGIIPEKIVYGHIPMMITANCVIRTTDKCRYAASGNQSVLTDRYGKKFPVSANCLHCMNIIYNSVPLSLHQHLDKWKKQTDIRLHFTVEEEKQTMAVIRYFYDALQGKTSTLPYAEYTTGHEKRGVE